MFNIVLIVVTCSKHYLKNFMFIATMQLHYSNWSYKLHYFTYVLELNVLFALCSIAKEPYPF